MAVIFHLSCKQELKKSSSFSETFRFGYKAQMFCLIFVFHWTNCLLFNHCFIRICFPKSTRDEEGQIYFWASRLFKWSQIQLTIELFLLCWFKRFLTWTNNITSYIRSEEDVFSKKKKKKNHSKTQLDERQLCFLMMLFIIAFSLFLHCTSDGLCPT